MSPQEWDELRMILRALQARPTNLDGVVSLLDNRALTQGVTWSALLAQARQVLAEAARARGEAPDEPFFIEQPERTHSVAHIRLAEVALIAERARRAVEERVAQRAPAEGPRTRTVKVKITEGQWPPARPTSGAPSRSKSRRIRLEEPER